MINKVSYDFENIRIDLGPAGEVTGVTAISYAVSVESEMEYGSDREPFDATEGTIAPEDASITLKEYAFRNLVEKLGPGWMTKAARFDISSAYAHEGEPVVTDVLQRCRITGVSKDHSQGSDGLEVELTLQVMKIIYGGFDPAVA